MGVSIPVGFSGSLQRASHQRIFHGDFSVSIPVGFSGSLQPQAQADARFFGPGVSIPVGFSGSLQLGNDCVMGVWGRFQSLSGFLVRCNRRSIGKHSEIFEFQSLSGFLVRCNRQGKACHIRHFVGFNPCRVFWFVATSLTFSLRSMTLQSFNPCRVFWFVATELVDR